jgi:phosphoserine phosphatase
MKSDIFDGIAGGWRPDVLERIRAAVSGTKSGDQPVVVFDFDNTCIAGDIGELFAQYMIEGLYYRCDETFWSLVDEEDGREELRDLVQRCRRPAHWGGRTLEDVPQSEREDDPTFRTYLSEMSILYNRKLAREGKASCYPWAVQLHAGLSVADIRRWSEYAIADELSRDRKPTRLDKTSRGEDVEIHRGIRILGEIRDLMHALHRHNFQVWIVTASNRWTVECFAQRFDISPERVIGNQLVPGPRGLLSDQLVAPSLFRHGKVQAIKRDIGKRPSIVFGDSITDLEMLEAATDLAVLIDAGDPFMLEEAGNRGWAIQPQEEFSHLSE